MGIILATYHGYVFGSYDRDIGILNIGLAIIDQNHINNRFSLGEN